MTRLRTLRHHARVAAALAGAAFDPDRPLVANLIVTRRCNLSCGYCFEYDKVSPPVPLAVLRERIDHLARLRTVFVTLTGGETLLHPDIAAIVAYVRERGMTPMLNTNGYLLTRARIDALGAAGLYAMQLSIDNVTPNATTKKSLRPLLPKLRLLAAHARFKVVINTVLGSGPPEEALVVARTVTGLGLDAKVSLVRGADGAPLPLDERGRAIHDEIQRLRRTTLSEDFQVALLRDGEVDWKCRAGARFFHVCEDGLVHLCAPRVGAGATPLADYGVDDIRRAFATRKPCASRCPIAYAHQASRLDGWRPQLLVEAPVRVADDRVRLAVVA
jgi:MoaA/NifB/PqqE/SkfB family radical SAM enzyme